MQPSNRTKAKKKTTKKASINKASKLNLTSWQTSDQDEILRRKLRAEQETFKLENTEPKQQPYFSNFWIYSRDDKKYSVEIRSLTEHINSCDCADYRGNQLGTCKHIEYVLQVLRKLGVRKFAAADKKGSNKIEVYLDTTKDLTIRVKYPKQEISQELRNVVDKYFSTDGSLLGEVIISYPALVQAVNKHKEQLADKLRLSKHIDYFIDYHKINSYKKDAYNVFMDDAAVGKRAINPVKVQLYPYQQMGMLHLVFTERALLADEMGLGKTIQAVAACELLRQLRHIQRVLIITTASLKTEWEEQIKKFTDSSLLVIYGARHSRLKQYRQQSFYYIINYEQAVIDYVELQRILAPDVVVLDEAQRIKNWQTKTATRIKEIKSRYAFVLTGTPIENRIDDIYSLVQFLDPHVFGPLFRFNREFYSFDEFGRPAGYKNLNLLYQKLRPIMLCRQKSEVEDELPQRTVKNFFIAMDSEQYKRYAENQNQVSIILGRAKKRALKKEEFEKLQRLLACMRMICDTPYILDPECRISPKLNELQAILDDILSDNTAKVIIFSEWEKMLELIREMAEEQKIGIAWHTGSVPQKERRNEINRFKNDPECRLFLSTDAGSVGLNLQIANIVINMDLPWNPAKLEQRIARAWRKHQTRSVQVINLICENSIEHRMLFLLEQKKLMAKGALTGEGDLDEIKMPSGRAAFMERMNSLMDNSVNNVQITMPAVSDTGTTEHVVGLSAKTNDSIIVEDTNNGNNSHVMEKALKIKDSLVEENSIDLNSLHAYQNSITGKSVLLAVVNEDKASCDKVTAMIAKAAPELDMEMIDAKTFAIIQRLAEAGILTLNQAVHDLYDKESEEAQIRRQHKQLDLANEYLEKAQRKYKMAQVLCQSDFVDEAIAPLQDSFNHAVHVIGFASGAFQREISVLNTELVENLAACNEEAQKLVSLFSDISALIDGRADDLDIKEVLLNQKEIISLGMQIYDNKKQMLSF